MANVQEAFSAAWEEASRNGLRREAAWLHAAATAWMASEGFEFPSRPDITSGFRPPSEQLELIQAWNSGRREGMFEKPAERSWHMERLAWDVQTDVDGFNWYADAVNALAEKVNLPLKDSREWGEPGHFAVPLWNRPRSVYSLTV